MNKQRRKELEAAVSSLEEIKDKLDAFTGEQIDWNELNITERLTEVEAIRSTLEEKRDEEQEYYDNMPEGLQSGEKGDKAQEALDALDSACGEMETLCDTLGEAKDLIYKEKQEEEVQSVVDGMDDVISYIQTAVE